MSATRAIFGLEDVKGVLVVTPGGDALSFREADVVREIHEIRSRIGATPSPRVVIDLTGSGYVGTAMIGAFSDFAEQTRKHGGVFAVCSVSPELQSVLRVLKLDGAWPQFDTRRAAIKFARKAEA